MVADHHLVALLHLGQIPHLGAHLERGGAAVGPAQRHVSRLGVDLLHRGGGGFGLLRQRTRRRRAHRRRVRRARRECERTARHAPDPTLPHPRSLLALAGASALPARHVRGRGSYQPARRIPAAPPRGNLPAASDPQDPVLSTVSACTFHLAAPRSGEKIAAAEEGAGKGHDGSPVSRYAGVRARARARQCRSASRPRARRRDRRAAGPQGGGRRRARRAREGARGPDRPAPSRRRRAREPRGRPGGGRASAAGVPPVGAASTELSGARLEVYGFIQLDAIYDFDRVEPGVERDAAPVEDPGELPGRRGLRQRRRDDPQRAPVAPRLPRLRPDASSAS